MHTVLAEPVPLSPERLRKARRYAEEMCPDSVILGSLRADLREAMERGPELDFALALLGVMHPEDHADLDDHRDRGRRMLHGVMFAAAVAQALNERAERQDPNDPEQTGTFKEVDGQQLSAAQFLGRISLGMDPDVLKEEGERMAAEMAGMSHQEISKLWLQLGGTIGIPGEELERLASDSLGLKVVQGGAA